MVTTLFIRRLQLGREGRMGLTYNNVQPTTILGNTFSPTPAAALHIKRRYLPPLITLKLTGQHSAPLSVVLGISGDLAEPSLDSRYLAWGHHHRY